MEALTLPSGDSRGTAGDVFALIASAGTGVGVLDREGRLTYASAALADLLVRASLPPLASGDELLPALCAAFPRAGDALAAAFSRPEACALTLRRDSVPRTLQLHLERVVDGRRLLLLTRVPSDPVHDYRAVLEAEVDALTELGNRALFKRLLAGWSPDVSGHTSLAVLVIDLDRFKPVNDTLGHQAGDRLLRLVATRLRASVRESDVLVRMGGDEFVVLHSFTGTPDSARRIAERIVELTGRTFLLDGQPVHIGASVGIAALHHGTRCKSDLFRHADLALYAAKADGRGQVRFFDPELEARALARRDVELDLRRALPLGQFTLHYQPQVSIPEGRVVGFEALMRWQHPSRGLIEPASFIPLAEEIGEIHRIGRWVLQTACTAAASWPSHLGVAVNVSAQQFEDGRLVDVVSAALGHARLAPDRLELEITESVLMSDSPHVLAALEAIKAMGVRVALDDFGTGFSSLAYLNQFEFSKIKIDRTFVQQHEHDWRSSALVRSILAIGESLGMHTVAEGVETDEQRRALLDVGCRNAQGFLFGRPIPAADLDGYIASLRDADARVER